MTKSIETKTLINLALAVADALEDPTIPSPLMDGLREVGAGLVDYLSGESLAPQLRALAGMVQSGHTETRLEAETLATAAVGAKLSA